MAENKKKKYKKKKKKTPYVRTVKEKIIYYLIVILGLFLLILIRFGYFLLREYISFLNPDVIAVQTDTIEDTLSLFAWVILFGLLYAFGGTYDTQPIPFIRPKETPEEKSERKRKEQKIKELNKKYPVNRKWFILRKITIITISLALIASFVFPFVARTEIQNDGTLIRYSAFNNAYETISPKDIDKIEIGVDTLYSGGRVSFPEDYIYCRIIIDDKEYELKISEFRSNEDYVSFLNMHDIEKYSIDAKAISLYNPNESQEDNIVYQAITELIKKQNQSQQ